MIEWEATLQIECLDPVTGETVDDIDVSLRVDQQMAVVVNCVFFFYIIIHKHMLKEMCELLKKLKNESVKS